MNRQWAVIGNAGLLAVYLAIHAAAAGYAFYLVHELASDQVGAANAYVAAARDDYAQFLSIFLFAFTLATLSAASFIGIVRRASWARYLWAATTFALLALCAVSALRNRNSFQHFVYPLVAIAVGWWLLRGKDGAHAG